MADLVADGKAQRTFLGTATVRETTDTHVGFIVEHKDPGPRQPRAGSYFARREDCKGSIEPGRKGEAWWVYDGSHARAVFLAEDACEQREPILDRIWRLSGDGHAAGTIVQMMEREGYVVTIEELVHAMLNGKAFEAELVDRKDPEDSLGVRAEVCGSDLNLYAHGFGHSAAVSVIYEEGSLVVVVRASSGHILHRVVVEPWSEPEAPSDDADPVDPT